MHNTLIRVTSMLAAALAGLTIAGAAQAQPQHDIRASEIHMVRMQPHHVRHGHRIWVPAHREHGRLVRGHYVRR